MAAQPPGWLEREHERWQADDAAETATLQQLTELRSALAADAAARDACTATPTTTTRPSTTWNGTGQASAANNPAAGVRERRSASACTGERTRTSMKFIGDRCRVPPCPNHLYRAEHARDRPNGGSRSMSPIPDVPPYYRKPIRADVSAPDTGHT